MGKEVHLKSSDQQLEKLEYSNALFDIKYLFIDKIFSELLKINGAKKELINNDNHIDQASGIAHG